MGLERGRKYYGEFMVKILLELNNMVYRFSVMVWEGLDIFKCYVSLK